MNYSTAGWLSLILIGILICPYVLNLLNKKIFKTKNPNYKKVIKFLKKLHKPLGVAIVILGVVHGYMALGGFRLHTGTLLYVSILITGALGGAFYRLKKKPLFVWHKRMAAVSVMLFLVHFFFPSALYYLLR